MSMRKALHDWSGFRQCISSFYDFRKQQNEKFQVYTSYEKWVWGK